MHLISHKAIITFGAKQSEKTTISIQGPEDWESILEVVTHFKKEGKKNLVAHLKAVYSRYKENPLIVDENDDDDDERTESIDQSSDDLLEDEPSKKKTTSISYNKAKATSYTPSCCGRL